MHTNKYKSANRIIKKYKNIPNDSLIDKEISALELYTLLKNKPFLINTKDNNQNTFLSYAIKRNNEEIIDLLLTSSILDLSYIDNLGNTYLHLSIIYHSNLNIINKLVKKGIDLNKQNLDGNTALHLAYLFNTKNNDNTEIINFLINQGVNISIKNKNFKTAVELDTNPSSKIEINKSIKMDWSTGTTINNHSFKENAVITEGSVDLSSKENNNLSLKNENLLINDNCQEEDLVNMLTINCNFNDVNEGKDKIIKIEKIKHLSPDYVMRRKIIKSERNNDDNSRNEISNMNEFSSLYKNNCNTTGNKEITNIRNYNISKKTNKINLFFKTKKMTYKKKLMILNSSYSNKNTDIINNKKRNDRKSQSINAKLIEVKKNSVLNNEIIKIYRRTNTAENLTANNFSNNTINHNIKSKKKLIINDNCDNLKSKKDGFKNTHLSKYIFNIELRKHKKSLSNPKINCHTQSKNYINNTQENNSEIINIITNEDIKNDLYDFLSEIHMENYFKKLKINGFDDINMLMKQISFDNIKDSELIEIGIKKPGDRAKILIRLQEKSNGFNFPIPTSVYYTVEDFNSVSYKENPCINRLFEWLKEIKIENYIENFISNGYCSLDLLLIQMISKNPLNDDILKNEIGIDKLGHRSRILSRLKDEGFSLYNKLKNKVLNINTNKEKDDQKICGCIIV